jgi:hypothetical protein
MTTRQNTSCARLIAGDDSIPSLFPLKCFFFAVGAASVCHAFFGEYIPWEGFAYQLRVWI